MSKLRIIGRWTAPTALGLAGIMALVGCGGGNDGIVTPTATPIATVTATTSGTVGPTTTATTQVTATPTVSSTPISAGTVTVFFADGTINNGRFVQEGAGTYARYNVVAPTPTPTNTAGPSPTPEPTAAPSVFYTGSYVLSNNERGTFFLVDRPATSTEDDYSGGVPVIASNRTYQFPPVDTGTATISVQVNGSSGSGTIRLSNGVTGTCTLSSRTTASLRALQLARSLTKKR